MFFVVVVIIIIIIIIFSDFVQAKIGYVGLQTIIECPLTKEIPVWQGPPSKTTYVNQNSPTINPSLPQKDRLSVNVDGNLVLTNTQPSDSGLYECAYAGLGSHEISLEVQCK